MNRTAINTGILRKKYILEYEDFFSECDLVISAPILFTWAGSFSVHFGGISLLQKLPLKTYIGIKKNNCNCLRYKSFKAYAPHRSSFVNVPIDSFLDASGLDRVQEFLDTFKNNDNEKLGYDIYILSENDWIDTCPIYSSISLLILLVEEIIDIDFFHKLSSKENDYLHSQEFEKIFRYLWKIFLMLEHDTPLSVCGAEIINCLVTSKFPIMYMTEMRIGGGGYQNLTKIPHSLIRDHSSIDDIRYWFKTLDDISITDEIWPFRFGIVYPGYRRVVEYKNQGQENSGKVDQIKYFMERNSDLIDQKLDIPGSILGIENNSTDILKSKLTLTQLYSIEIINTYIKSFVSKDATDFIIALKQLKDLYNVVFQQHLTYKHTSFEKKFVEWLQKSSSEDNCYFIQEKAIEGDSKLLYVMSKKVFPYFNEDFEQTELTDYYNAFLDYDSVLDGIGTEGARLEMYREKKYYSDWLKNYSNHTWINNFHEKKLIEDKAELEKIKILINTVTEKIILNGTKLTSNDLPSQVYAIQVLTLLMKAPAHQIESRELPLSAYSVSKSDFMTKILRPLEKAFDKYLGEGHGITFECEGTLTEFRTKINVHPDTIWFLSEVDYK